MFCIIHTIYRMAQIYGNLWCKWDQGDSMTQNKMKIKSNKIMLEVSFLKKSTLKICEIYVNFTNSQLGMNE